MRRTAIALLLLCPLTFQGASHGGVPGTVGTKEALQGFNDLIGSWRGTGRPLGTAEEAQKAFWTETVEWEWQFRGADAWLAVRFVKGRHFLGGELRFLPADNRYQLTVETTARERLVFTGPRQERVLTLERTDPAGRETQRLVLNLLHPNRFLYHYEVRPQGKVLFKRLYQVGATKEGVPFATGDGKPECVVSGGLGTMPVSYKGRTYYVCCGGCRTEFNEDPEKYVREYEAKQKSKGTAPR